MTNFLSVDLICFGLSVQSFNYVLLAVMHSNAKRRNPRAVEDWEVMLDTNTYLFKSCVPSSNL